MESRKIDLIIPAIGIALIASLVVLIQGIHHVLSI